MNLAFDTDELRELCRPIVEETVAAVASAMGGDQLAYTEREAARILGIAPHQLADARRRGEITATKVGGRLGYETTELIAYLARGRRD